MAADKTSRWPGMVFLLQRKRRTINELCSLLGSHRAAISRNLYIMESEGLVKQGDEPGNKAGAKTWTWVKV